jgi:hypothetical protein
LFKKIVKKLKLRKVVKYSMASEDNLKQSKQSELSEQSEQPEHADSFVVELRRKFYHLLPGVVTVMRDLCRLNQTYTFD